MSLAGVPIDAVATQFQFLRPWWLLGLLAVPLLPWWLARLRARRNAWREAVDAHLLAHLLQDAQAARAGWRPRLALAVPAAALALTLLALAGPSWRQSAQPLWQDRNPLVIALDLSRATLAEDVQPSRLLQARAKIARILATRGGGQIALVAFAEDAYTVAPLTDDAGNIALFLDALSPAVMPNDGSRADHAIEESMRLLQRAGFGRGDILLITDQAGGSATSAAATARRSGFRVSVLGMGTAAGGGYETANGKPQRAQLDGAGLSSMASAGGGAYAAVAVDNADLDALGVLAADRIDAASAQGRQGVAPLDEGYWLLPLLLLLALLAFRRGVLAVALLALCLPWQAVLADDGDLWHRADQAEHARMQRGVQAYRGGDYAEAEQALQGLSGADAAYNRGNALAKQGRYDEAIAAYDDALRQRPAMAQARENRSRVEAARKRKPPPSSKPQDKKNDGKSDPGKSPPKPPRNDKQQPGADTPRDASDGPKAKPKPDAPRNEPPEPQNSRDPGKPQDGPPPRNKPGQPPGSGQGAPAPPPAAGEDGDPKSQAQRQREADAALRERMRRAQAAGARPPPAGAPARAGGPTPKPAETPAQRERRIANEAMLRRVPDDPGGLLREKFLLEKKRRRREGDR